MAVSPSLGIPMWGFPAIGGPFWGPYKKACSIWGSILGPPYSRKLSFGLASI